MKNNSGIALILLILIVIIVGVIIAIGVKYTKQYVHNQENEDIKATMLAIQSVTRNVKNKHLVDKENNSLIGEKLELEKTEGPEETENEDNNVSENETEEMEETENKVEDKKPQSKYKLPDELENILLNIEDADFYILSKEDLENHGIKDVNVSETEFYIVDYNTEEVYYSLGVEGTYSLSEL